jgi:16S rRNA (adenine1518-N6/adenine1519-N6)-dimethyltransferase
MNITFRQLKLFLALAETGSVSAAAKVMHVTQPTASMQLKEVAQSVAAQPGDMGILSVGVQLYGRPSIVDYIPPTSFYPPPKVDSAIVRMIPRLTGTGEAAKDLAIFARVVTAAFSQRRKMLRNTLREFISEADLAALGIAPTARAEDIAVPDYVRLANSLSDLARR